MKKYYYYLIISLLCIYSCKDNVLDTQMQSGGHSLSVYFYTDASFLYHLKSNPSNLSRNVTDEIIGVYNYLFNITLLIRESVAIIVIFLLVLIVDPISAISICLFLGIISIINIKKLNHILKLKQ